jgi:DNA polymerase-3 subunit delta'
MSLPWLEAAFVDIASRKKSLPTVIMISGAEGIGKLSLANQTSKGLLCLNDQHGQSCEDCRACHLFDSGNHPDYHLVTNEYILQTVSQNIALAGKRYLSETEKSKAKRKTLKHIIGIEQIRCLIGELSITAHVGITKVAVICPANVLNVNAANALLKTLEEPPSNTYFLLITEAPHLLPPTIRSRCVQYNVPIPNPEQSLFWLRKTLSLNDNEAKKLLKFANNAPLTAVINFEDGSYKLAASLPSDLKSILKKQITMSTICEKWSQINVRIPLRWLQREILSAFRSGVGIDTTNSGRLLYRSIGLKRCLDIYIKVGNFLSWPINAVDEKLFLESVIADLIK